MTFIIAIQLEDGVVVAVDNKNIQLKDKNINGHFEISNAPEVELPENVQYSFSWIRD